MQNQTINKIFVVKGMHCASCASIIERTVKKIDGVTSVSVNNGNEKAKITFDSEKTSPEEFNKKLSELEKNIEPALVGHNLKEIILYGKLLEIQEQLNTLAEKIEKNK